jgi:enoyl-CoA hydratase
MAYENLLVDVSDRIATITINRPKSLNALNWATIQELSAALEEIARGRDVGVVLLTGAGEKAFVAGADISEMRGFTPLQVLEFSRFGHGVLEKIERLPQPVIGVINGFALGGGCELAMACDMLLAADTARFGQPEVNLVNRVVPQAGLMETAQEIARKILEKAPVALRTAKSVMNRGIDLDLESACALEANAFAVMFSTEDGAEGMTAFLDKRKPVFGGK